MRYLIHKLKSTSLFIKIALITFICSLCIFIFTSSVTLNISKKVLIDTFSNSNHKILHEVSNNYAHLNDNIANVISIIEYNSNFKNYLTEDYNDSKNDFFLLYNINKEFDVLPTTIYNNLNIFIIGKNGKTFIKGHNYFYFDKDELQKSNLTEKIVASPGKLIYGFSNYKKVNNNSYSTAITAAKTIVNKDTNEIYGYIYIVIPQDQFREFYMPFVGISNSIKILAQDGTIVSSSIYDEIGKKDTSIFYVSNNTLSRNINIYNQKYNNINATILSVYMPYYNFNLVGIIDKDIIINKILNTSQIYIFNILIVVFFMVITSEVIRKTTNPLSILSKKMSKMPSGNFNDYLEVKGSNEVRQLTNAYNYMLDDINKYMNDIIKIEKEKRIAEIHALQMQINPHFLYNTLTSIKWLIWQNANDKSVKTIDAFIALLQNTISNKNEMITIDEEIENLKNYVFINHIRYGNKIKVNYFVNPECNKYKIPKLILQPFIENSFFHGFIDRDNGLISIFINKNETNIIAEIIDNGVGISETDLDNIFDSNSLKEHFTSIGINNVNDRIKLLYGDEYGVTISSEINLGTSVKIVFPIQI